MPGLDAIPRNPLISLVFAHFHELRTRNRIVLSYRRGLHAGHLAEFFRHPVQVALDRAPKRCGHKVYAISYPVIEDRETARARALSHLSMNNAGATNRVRPRAVAGAHDRLRRRQYPSQKCNIIDPACNQVCPAGTAGSRSAAACLDTCLDNRGPVP